MSDPRHPDGGVPDQCASAAVSVDGFAQSLTDAAAEVRTEVAALDDRLWAGRAADAFRGSAATLGPRAEGVVAAWQRLAEAIEGYATALAALQLDGDATRTALTAAEDELADLRLRRARAQADVLHGDGTAAGQVVVLNEQIADEQRTVGRHLADLQHLATARTLLDERTAAELLAAPGAGAPAWADLAFRPNGSRRPVPDVVADVLDRLDRPGELAGEDYDLVAQLLALHSGDPDTMAAFVDGLGADGLMRFVNSFAGGGGPCGYPPGEVTATDLCEALAGGLATASQTWDRRRQIRFGRDLVDAAGENLTAAPGAELIGAQAVAYLIGTDGVAPAVALGALERLEEIRVEEPGRFADLTATIRDGALGTGVFAHLPVSLPDAVFRQLAAIPDQALDLFATRPEATTEYWFGVHDWAHEGFTGPAVLVDAIVNRPEVQAVRWAVPPAAEWLRTVAFASDAFQALGGNVALRVGAMSPEAARAVAAGLGAFVGEVVGGVDLGRVDDDDGSRFVAVLGPNNELVMVPGLDTDAGNLSRLLGIALQEPQALARYGGAVGTYATRVRDYVLGPSHPSAEVAEKLLGQIGELYGLTYGSYAREAERRASALSDLARRELDRVFLLAALAPGVASGSAIVDYLVQIGLVGLEAGGEWAHPDIASPQELDAIIDAGLSEGEHALAGFAGSLTAGWGAVDPPYTTPDGRPVDVDALIETLTVDYSTFATAFSNDVGTGTYDVVVPGVPGLRNPGDMP